MCYAKPIQTKYDRFKNRYSKKIRNNKILANTFNFNYGNSRKKGYKVTKSFNYAKNKTQQSKLKGKILVKKWKGTKEIITSHGKKGTTGKWHYLPYRSKMLFKYWKWKKTIEKKTKEHQKATATFGDIGGYGTKKK